MNRGRGQAGPAPYGPFTANAGPYGVFELVAYHLEFVGRPGQLCTEDALSLIHMTLNGYPRGVNNFAVQSLVAAVATGRNLVDDTFARATPGRWSTELVLLVAEAGLPEW